MTIAALSSESEVLRKTAKNTVKHRGDDGVGSVVATSQPPRWRRKFGGRSNTVYFTTFYSIF